MRALLFVLLSAGAAQAAPADSPLRAFDFLAGHCWQGEFANGAVDTRCVSWMYGGRHVRDVHLVRGEDGDYCGETVYSVDGASKGIMFRYFNSLGGVSEGTMTWQGGAFVAPETYVGKDGNKREFRSTLRPLDGERYEAVTQESADGEWQTASRIVFKRIGRATAEAILQNGCE